MQDEPTPVELTKAVADFLRTDIAPLIAGHQAFKLRVAINALDLVVRQLTLSEASDAAEAERSGRSGQASFANDGQKRAIELPTGLRAGHTNMYSR